MSNVLSKKFTFWSLLKFTLPTIIMMVFMSMYTMVDGIFVSRLIGTSALSAVNIVYPVINVVLAVGIMLATGGSAVIAKKMGESRNVEAKENFSLVVCVGVVAGAVITLVGFLFADPLLRFLGANDAVYQYCYDYMTTLLPFVVPSILQMLFQYFFVTAGKPTLGLLATLIGGCTNIVLDYVFIAPLDMGVAGAALATGIGYAIPGIFGLFYFLWNKKGTLYFLKPKFDSKVLLRSCTNGASEMVTNLAIAVTTLLFNLVMMERLGEDGVAAITVVLYAQFLLSAVYLGYSSGVAPVVSYNYGDKDTVQLKKVFKISLQFLIAASLVTFVIALLSSDLIVSIFTLSGSPVFDLAVHGFDLFAISYLFMGINIFASAFFTALSNGKISALISFLRTFVLLVVCILLLPYLIGIDGIWLSVPIAEAAALFISIHWLRKKHTEYGYA
ncbi:MATE family efflux transporter [Christensenellaceae bacterium OttesenSCG-928-K19]|nr:MATE family efflux transporter [Christensenellaceae bacterium OttesenSCG-928-K19]